MLGQRQVRKEANLRGREDRITAIESGLQRQGDWKLEAKLIANAKPGAILAQQQVQTSVKHLREARAEPRWATMTQPELRGYQNDVSLEPSKQ